MEGRGEKGNIYPCIDLILIDLAFYNNILSPFIRNKSVLISVFPLPFHLRGLIRPRLSFFHVSVCSTLCTWPNFDKLCRGEIWICRALKETLNFIKILVILENIQKSWTFFETRNLSFLPSSSSVIRRVFVMKKKKIIITRIIIASIIITSNRLKRNRNFRWDIIEKLFHLNHPIGHCYWESCYQGNTNGNSKEITSLN